ncbi:MAG: hypothetical protein DRJ10_02355 [Bacteroidetes bacterium]|nr:MAG: hypothetical protein DRJ10_02355 [Bacteroidota bacterium]
MRRIILLIAITILINSCKDKCRYVDPPSICGVELEFEILNNADKNIFIEDYTIDSLQIFGELNDSIVFTINKTDKTFQFEIFDCWKEDGRFNNSIIKNFFLKFNSIEIDTISFDFKPIDPATECGGTDFDFLKIIYKDRTYDGNYNSPVNRLYK